MMEKNSVIDVGKQKDAVKKLQEKEVEFSFWHPILIGLIAFILFIPLHVAVRHVEDRVSFLPEWTLILVAIVYFVVITVLCVRKVDRLKKEIDGLKKQVQPSCQSCVVDELLNEPCEVKKILEDNERWFSVCDLYKNETDIKNQLEEKKQLILKEQMDKHNLFIGSKEEEHE